MKLTVNVTYDITPQRISDLFASAFEGGINYWAQDAELTATAAPMRSDLVWWGCPEHFEGPFVFELHYDDPDDDEGEGPGISLSALEEKLKPEVLATFEEIEGLYKKLHKMQHRRLETMTSGEEVTTRSEKTYERQREELVGKVEQVRLHNNRIEFLFM